MYMLSFQTNTQLSCHKLFYLLLLYVLYTFVSVTTPQIIFWILAIIVVVHQVYLHSKLLHLFKKSHTMATYTDLQTASQALSQAAADFTEAIIVYQAAHANDITAAQADTIVQDITAATQALTAATQSLQA